VSSEAARYVAIITDGNGRWAQARGLPVIEGHRAGADTVKARLRDAVDLGVKELTVYSFSTENWSRPREEVDGLMAMFAERIDRERRDLMIELAADQLDDQACYPGALAFRRSGLVLHAGELHRQQPTLDLHQAVAQGGIIDRLAGTDALFLHQLRQHRKPPPRRIGIAEHAALVLERCVGDQPALSAPTHDVFLRHAHVGERVEHLADRGSGRQYVLEVVQHEQRGAAVVQPRDQCLR